MAEADLTIDELARRVGMTVRNVRSHQTRGLLPGPEVRGRVGFYGEVHVERLRLIQELQDNGLPLRLVERLLTGSPDAAARLVAMRHALPTAEEGAAAEVISVETVLERFGEFDEETLARAVELGALVPRTDGTFLVPRPELLALAERVMRLGIPLASLLRVAIAVQGYSNDAARTFVELIRDEVWAPYHDAGRPASEFSRIAATIEELRPVASEFVLLLLPQAIADEAERVYGQELRDQAEQAGD